MSLLLAAFIACGTSVAQVAPDSPKKVCIAYVFHTINATPEQCRNGVISEGLSAENKLLKGGYWNTSNTAWCDVMDADSMSDKALIRRMTVEMGADKGVVNHLDFINGKFVMRAK